MKHRDGTVLNGRASRTAISLIVLLSAPFAASAQDRLKTMPGYDQYENKTGYDAGSLMTYADKLKGRLMLYWGTADNNVHPSNMMQFIAALQRSGKASTSRSAPTRGHSG